MQQQFEVYQYHTYADRFSVFAETMDEADQLVQQWYDSQPYRLPEPILHRDPDVAPVVLFYDKDDYVCTDGTRVIAPDGEEEDFN